MGIFSKDIETMNDLFVHQLKDIYYAEKRIIGALPQMIEKATSPELKSAFESHLGETQKPRKTGRAGFPNAWRHAGNSRLPCDRRDH